MSNCLVGLLLETAWQNTFLGIVLTVSNVVENSSFLGIQGRVW